MAGRILQDDIEEVRHRARIDDVVQGYVTLRRAGAGTLKGLCPFHDEKTPSFQVTPARGLYYCFGCGAGGDVVRFVEQISNLSFPEAIEFLAQKYGVQLRYTETDSNTPPAGARTRLLEANAQAAEFYATHLRSPEAEVARRFLTDRGFDQTTAERFGVGFAPRDGRALVHHLRSCGHSEEELIAAGLARRGGWDYFQGRVVWPIRDAGRATLGFGARRLLDDDRLPAKYINTPETSVYKKSHVLYGLDLARVSIGKKSQAVIVEGYTDVMACHVAGVDTAVASCGTAFGDDHARLIQRLMGGDAFHGEVVFTFDGDAAGQKAALKVFDGDANFASQTYVAVEPGGLDPCDLRLQGGDAAVRELVARREPLYRFVMRNVLSHFDLDRADARLGAVREAAGLIRSIRDRSLVDAYVRELASLAGMDLEEVRRAVARAPHSGTGRRPSGAASPGSGRGGTSSGQGYGGRGPVAGPPSAGSGGTDPGPSVGQSFEGNPSPPPGPAVPHAHPLPESGPGADEPPPDPADLPPDSTADRSIIWPDPDDRTLQVERDILRMIVQRPDLFEDAPQPWFGVTVDDFTDPAYRAVFATIAHTEARRPEWAQRVLLALPDPALRDWAIQLAVQPILTEPTGRHAREYGAKLQLLTLGRTLGTLKSRMQRTNPLTDQAAYEDMFKTMIDLEVRRKELLQISIGDD
jgi:DNA primase